MHRGRLTKPKDLVNVNLEFEGKGKERGNNTIINTFTSAFYMMGRRPVMA